MNEASTIFSLIHQTLSGGENELSVSMMCQTAGVSRSGYYAWLNAASARQVREAQDRADFELVLEAYNRRRYSKGARGIYMCLIHNTPPVVMNLKKIRRLMKKYGLQCPIRRANPYRKMKNAMKTNHYAPNLLDREFESYGPRLVLLTDITYIPWGGSFLYLCVIMDAYTKQVLSYTLSPSLEVDFVLDAVDILMREHGVSLHAETVIHSDQGCHYTSCKFIELVEHNELRRSMSRKGNCWDNAPQESFFGHMKDLIDLTGDPSFDEVKAIIDDYMSYYNNERYQWDLAKLSPNEYFSFVTTGVYPLDLPSKPSPPEISKTPNELGAHTLEPEIVSDPLIIAIFKKANNKRKRQTNAGNPAVKQNQVPYEPRQGASPDFGPSIHEGGPSSWTTSSQWDSDRDCRAEGTVPSFPFPPGPPGRPLHGESAYCPSQQCLRA